MSDIIAVLYNDSPKALFTADISKTMARDEEFIKRLLLDLQSKELVIAVRKNPKGKPYSARTKWRISAKIYETYRKLQDKGVEVY